MLGLGVWAVFWTCLEAVGAHLFLGFSVHEAPIPFACTPSVYSPLLVHASKFLNKQPQVAKWNLSFALDLQLQKSRGH